MIDDEIKKKRHLRLINEKLCGNKKSNCEKE